MKQCMCVQLRFHLEQRRNESLEHPLKCCQEAAENNRPEASWHDPAADGYAVGGCKQCERDLPPTRSQQSGHKPVENAGRWAPALAAMQ